MIQKIQTLGNLGKLVGTYILPFVASASFFAYAIVFSGFEKFPAFALLASKLYSEKSQIQDTSLNIKEGKLLMSEGSLLSLSSVFVPPSGYSVEAVYFLDVTGYSSTYRQTDEDPYISASNKNVRWGIVATNFPDREHALSFGTQVRIPELFPDQIFVVEDRMNQRFHDRLDIWFPSESQASEFGIHRNVAVEVLRELDNNRSW